MNNFIINGVKVSEEQYYRIKNRKPIPDEEIDFSDIPETTEEEFKRFFRANPRTPEQWEQFHKYCPLKHQARLKKMREALGHKISEPPEHLKNLVIW